MHSKPRATVTRSSAADFTGESRLQMGLVLPHPSGSMLEAAQSARVPRMSPDADDRITETMSVVERGRETSNPPVRPSARLVCVVGHCVGQVFAIDGAGPVVIGRGADAHVAIDGDEISRRHAQLDWQRGGFVLTDLGSRNGTLVNNVPVREQRLSSGDRIQLGGWTLLVFSVDDELEKRALRLQRLESLASLTGGIVHDFKNSLGSILTNAELLQAQIASGAVDDEATDTLNDIVLAARASLETARRLLYFADRDVGSGLALVDIRSVVDEVMALSRRQLAQHRVKIDVDVQPGLAIRGTFGEVHHLLLNLVLNAREAMPRGGALSVRALEVDLARSEALELHLPAAGRYVEIVIADSGIGMDAATQARAFEPFFTTKPSGEGTGLGLATVYGVVRRYGGNILISSAPERGTRMRLLLPRA
jgi:signal transduction histidine kinase